MNQVIGNAIVAGAMYALVALGFGLVYSVTRFFNFAYGAVYALGAYAAFTASAILGWPFAVAVMFGICCGVGLGCLIEACIFRPLRQSRSSSLVLLLASLGVLICVQNSLSLVFRDQPRVLRLGPVEQGVLVFGARITSVQLAIVIACAVLTITTWFVLHGTRWGLKIRAMGNDSDLAHALGIDRDRTMLVTFAIGSALASAAGILVGLDTDLVPSMGFHALLMGVAASIVGGIGRVSGAVLGGLLIGFARHLGVWKLPTQWQDAVVFAVLIVFLIMRPQGFRGRPLVRRTVG